MKESLNNPPRLNLGCGTDIRRGFVNLDHCDLPGVDVVHDLQKLPLPFEDSSFELIICRDILEHLDYIPLLEEIHRISLTLSYYDYVRSVDQ